MSQYSYKGMCVIDDVKLNCNATSDVSKQHGVIPFVTMICNFTNDVTGTCQLFISDFIGDVTISILILKGRSQSNVSHSGVVEKKILKLQMILHILLQCHKKCHEATLDVISDVTKPCPIFNSDIICNVTLPS